MNPTNYVTAADGALYDSLRRAANARVNKHPAVIARCQTADDVVEALAYARAHGLRVGPRGRGHGYTGDAIVEGGLVLDLRPMNRIVAAGASGRMVVGAGARVGDVVLHAYRAGLGFPSGGATDVGVAGFTLGGGYGDLGRSLGLACDRAVSFDVVSAAGERFTVDHDHHPELFWALRGAGGGHFVTVLSFTYQLDPLPAELPTMSAIFALDDLEPLLETYLPYFEGDAPDAVHVLLSVQTFPGLPAVCALAGVYNGTDQAAADAEFTRLLGGLTPITSDNRREVYFNFKRRFDGNLPSDDPWVCKGRFLRRGTAPRALSEVILHHVRSAPNRDFMAAFSPFGGQILRGDRLTSAFAHRDESMGFDIITRWKRPHEAEANEGWARSFAADITPFWTGGVYANEIDDELVDWKFAYFGNNYERLRAVKRSWDPTGLFVNSAQNLL